MLNHLTNRLEIGGRFQRRIMRDSFRYGRIDECHLILDLEGFRYFAFYRQESDREREWQRIIYTLNIYLI